MPTPKFIALSVASGCLFALGCMGIVAARAAYTISVGHRWHQLKKL